MDALYDFSDANLKVSVYDGAASKRTMLLDGHQYMVKFGYEADYGESRSSRTSYVNTPVSEYIGSKVFAASGIPTQEVLLGVWRGHSVVACRDFMHDLDPELMLLHFKQLEISMPGESSGRSKARPDWEYVRHVLDGHDSLEGLRQQTWRRFRQMICVDALIGNYDRHANNWGFIANRRTADILGLAPVYDCGSSLAPSISAETMRQRLEDPELMRESVIDSPTIAMNVRGKRRKYSYFMTADYAREFRRELPELWPRLSREVTDDIVAQTPGLDDLHRDFYRTLLDARRDHVLAPAYRMALRGRESEDIDYDVSDSAVVLSDVPGVIVGPDSTRSYAR